MDCKFSDAGNDCELLLFAAPPTVKANDQPSAANAAVKIDNFVFGPQTITVPVGTTVTWTNS